MAKNNRNVSDEYSDMSQVGELEIIEFYIEESEAEPGQNEPVAKNALPSSAEEAEADVSAPEEGPAEAENDDAVAADQPAKGKSVCDGLSGSVFGAKSDCDPADETFKVSYFGVNVAKVLEVIESPIMTPPAAATHPSFMGTIPLREKILPVLDLSVWLGLKRKKSAHEVILVTEFHSRITGFLVSGVTQIYNVPWSHVEAPNRYLSMQEANCITGMVKIEDHFVLMLDFESIIAELDPEYNVMFSHGHEDVDEGGPVYHALVAEDSSYMRHAMDHALSKTNFEVDFTVNGEDAWAKITDIKNKALAEGKRFSDFVDVIITDIEMPKMDGYSLVSLIKSDNDLKDIPVILFSSIISNELRHKGEKVGADEQISKPEIGTLGKRAIQLIVSKKEVGA